MKIRLAMRDDFVLQSYNNNIQLRVVRNKINYSNDLAVAWLIQLVEIIDFNVLYVFDISLDIPWNKAIASFIQI